MKCCDVMNTLLAKVFLWKCGKYHTQHEKKTNNKRGYWNVKGLVRLSVMLSRTI